MESRTLPIVRVQKKQLLHENAVEEPTFHAASTKERAFFETKMPPRGNILDPKPGCRVDIPAPRSGQFGWKQKCVAQSRRCFKVASFQKCHRTNIL